MRPEHKENTTQQVSEIKNILEATSPLPSSHKKQRTALLEEKRCTFHLVPRPAIPCIIFLSGEGSLAVYKRQRKCHLHDTCCFAVCSFKVTTQLLRRDEASWLYLSGMCHARRDGPQLLVQLPSLATKSRRSFDSFSTGNNIKDYLLG